MIKFPSHCTFATALLVGLVSVAGCGATAADPSDTTPQPEPSAAPVAKNEQALEHGPNGSGAHGDKGHHQGWMHRQHDPEKLFARMDKDGDGKIPLTDIPERMREHLAKADTDKDGALTRDELKAAHETRKAAWMKRVDTNGDGTVSDEEKTAARAKFGHGPWHHGDEHQGGPVPADSPTEH